MALFVVVSAVDAPMIIGGSIAGARFPDPGIFIGAIVGGVAGVGLGARIAVWTRLISDDRYWGTVLGGVTGFVAAAIIATRNLHTPVIPALCGMLIGLGAAAGSRTGTREPQRSR